jgi:acetyl esterase/lipase
MDPITLYNVADVAYPLWDAEPIDGAFTLEAAQDVSEIVVSSVARPWLFGFEPTSSAAPPHRAILILAGGGYVELMVGREGVQVARWLASLGFHAFVLVHRFPNEKTKPQAPIDDARKALKMMKDNGYGKSGIAVCGLSSGGHLGAALLASYPSTWTETDPSEIPKIDFAIIGYGPISTNAKGRQIVKDKAPLEPPEKQELYDIVQPDAQLKTPAPPTFIVYSGNDSVVPVVNAYRLVEGITKAGGAVELHVFADAPHGFGIDTLGLPVMQWTKMCERWLQQGGWVK